MIPIAEFEVVREKLQKLQRALSMYSTKVFMEADCTVRPLTEKEQEKLETMLRTVLALEID